MMPCYPPRPRPHASPPLRCSIDGSTPPKRKQELKNAFQENPAVQVAVVGLTAAGVGLSFTAASMSVFAELHWTPVRGGLTNLT
jgi:SNF2 family DNA or RNA helicase